MALVLAGPLGAATPDEIARLWTARGLDVEIPQMIAGGLDYGRELDQSMLKGRGGAAWLARVQAIFDEADLTADLHAALERELAPIDVSAVLAYSESPLGRRFAERMLVERGALTDGASVQDALDELAEDDPERTHWLRKKLETSGYLDQAVAAGLNYYGAFLRAAMADGAFGPPITEAQVQIMLHNAEPTYRQQALDGMLASQMKVYAGFTDAELQEMSVVTDPDAFDKVDVALFRAYEQVFIPRYVELGQELSKFALEKPL